MLGFFSTITQGICYISSVFPCIYIYTLKQIKVIFHLNPSQQDMIFPFNDSSELTVTACEEQQRGAFSIKLLDQIKRLSKKLSKIK